MSAGMDVSTLMQSLGGGGAPMGGEMGMEMGPPMAPPMEEKPDPVKLITEALQLIRQATDADSDPQGSMELEQISSAIQKYLANDHAATLGSMGMKPGMNRILAKAAG